MDAKRLSMPCVEEVLRQKWVWKKSHREVGRALEISSGFVSSVITRAAAKGLTTWAEGQSWCRQAASRSPPHASSTGLRPLVLRRWSRRGVHHGARPRSPATATTPEPQRALPVGEHENVRGPANYQH